MRQSLVKIKSFPLEPIICRGGAHQALLRSLDISLTMNTSECIQLPFSVFFFIIELFFCKKIPLSRRVVYVMDGSMDESVSR